MARQKTAVGADLDRVGAVLDLISFERLEELYPDLAAELERAVSSGAKPGQVRRFALARGMPKPWVAWLENAARAVQAANDG